MDFYDSLFQYDLEVQNKLTERINSFIKSINVMKNESLINQPINKDLKYKHIHTVIDEINSSNKFKTKLLLNQKKQLLIRMNNKNKSKINSKYYIYAKEMNQDNQKIDIIQIENALSKKDLSLEQNFPKNIPKLKLDNCFNQKNIFYENDKKNGTFSEEEKILNKLKSDINKIVCDLIKQNVKKIYNQKLNEISLSKIKLNGHKDKNTDINCGDSRTINNIKNNNYIKIDLPKKEIFFRDAKEGKENKKIHNNHSTDKNTNLINYFNDNKKKSIKKELRKSVANNNGNHLKIKVYKNDILNFNNLNNNNINNLFIINNKIKSAKNDINNNIRSERVVENENKVNQKEEIKPEQKDMINNNLKTNKNQIIDNEKKNNKKHTHNENNINKNGDQSHKKMIIRNIQRIQIKNIKLKNHPTGYNLTNICKKKLIDEAILEKNNLIKSKHKNRQCDSPGDVGLSNKKINILKFKLGKNDPTPIRKQTEKSFKKNKEIENYNENDNSTVSIINDKTKDAYSHAIRFSSVKKKKISDDASCNDFSEFCCSKKVNKNNFIIRNYKTNMERNTNIEIQNKNSFTKESEMDNYFIINRNNNMRKSLSKESSSHSYMKWNFDNINAVINNSNQKGNMIESYLNNVLKVEKKNNFENNIKNVNEYKKRNKKKNNTHYIYNENIVQNNNEFEQNNKEGNKKSKNNKNNYKDNVKENKNISKAGYNDTINNNEEPISYRGKAQIKGKRRILSTRVHIRGVNSSKNFNNIL